MEARDSTATQEESDPVRPKERKELDKESVEYSRVNVSLRDPEKEFISIQCDHKT